ncbi:fungal specific transcription factor domain-containing protein [Aspergillus affinis]|uniref:fungal specific transcription factor domain-containing protein n=1 Tax=Aspergillus affinis TaxID=1070780 RepID=UPI0022FE5C57|nr:uncharacterized protein KD926_001153 [Aspergillus affinis]KAI9036983.1 hypothetical protein KD926_001153 [Aspergillus affinis]
MPPGAQNPGFYPQTAPSDQDAQSILGRLDRIEAVLGINKDRPATSSMSVASDLDEEVIDVPFYDLWAAAKHLRAITRPPQDDSIWSRPTIKILWAKFLDNLPLLHFLKDQNAFSSPSPLLLASVLYISALHSPSAELASLAGGYLVAICSAIAELVIPSPLPTLLNWSSANLRQHDPSSSREEQHVFQNILGLIMASLCSEAFVETTDKWIAIAYRLLLDHCPTAAESTAQDWPGLFSGIQVIDIEHASMHMCHPLLPRQPPTSALQQLNSHEGDAYRGLTQIMHHGLSHFVRRGLPTIWSFVSAREPDTLPSVRAPFTDEDSQVIRLWAKKLDDWLVRYNGTSQPSPSDRQGIVILLQYHLHKLYVLSIYHPARGFDLSSANITPAERHELLVSARAVLRLRQDDASIWSNWDLIMITWAAMLLLRGVEDGVTHQDDLRLIQSHLQSLKLSHPSAPSIHAILADRLQSGIQSMNTPPDIGPELSIPGPHADYSWTIFDQEIMPLANPPWLFEGAAAAAASLASVPSQLAQQQQQSPIPSVGYTTHGNLGTGHHHHHHHPAAAFPAAGEHWEHHHTASASSVRPPHPPPQRFNRMFGPENVPGESNDYLM